MPKWSQFFKNPGLVTNVFVPKKAEEMVNTAANSAAGVSASIDDAVKELQEWRSLIKSFINFLDDNAIMMLGILTAAIALYATYKCFTPTKSQPLIVALDEKSIEHIAELTAKKVSNQNYKPALHM